MNSINEQRPRIRVYNTLTRQKDVLEKTGDDPLKFFVCGPTVYDYPHLGHAKTATQFDFIVRYLRWRGYPVTYVQNITDIDDKILERARSLSISWCDLAREYEAIYLEDMFSLHNTAVDNYARATDFIEAILSQIERLMERGYAYQTTDGVYFDISKFPDYGKLSGRTELREDDAVTRIDECAEKRNWNDFCLWKAHKTGEPAWESDLGVGRPGWHIEDTAITETLFGPQYDIHGGAIDLIFPHHEAEIAQMEAVSGRSPMVRYWIHTGFLNVDSEKMAKSKGNFRTIRDALKDYNYRTLRFLFLSSHYRNPIDYTDETLEQAKRAVRRLDEFIFNIDQGHDDWEDIEAIERLKREVVTNLDDDFSTPRAFAAIFDFIRAQNKKGKSGKRAYEACRELNELFDILSFEEVDLDSHIQSLIEERRQLRSQGDFEQADEIREHLISLGIQVYDTAEGPKLRREQRDPSKTP